MMDSQSRPVIEVCELSHSYFAGTPLEVVSLREVDLVLNRDENVGIIGPTGSGKSTLLSHLNGLIRPQKGDVRVFDESFADSRADVRKVRKRIGMLFQNLEQQLFERYAGDDVAFGPKNFDISGDELRIAVKRAMELVGLPFSYKDRLTTDLSLGEKRRLALAGVFALDPEILVLDEPTASLDPEGRRQVIEVLKQWRKRAGRSIVVVSHNMEDIVELTNRTYVLSEGNVVYSGATEELFANRELLIDQELGLTVTQQVIHRLLQSGVHIGKGILSALELAEEIGSVLHGTA
jgi:energy-coupling factor transport system ATP-binding protein